MINRQHTAMHTIPRLRRLILLSDSCDFVLFVVISLPPITEAESALERSTALGHPSPMGHIPATVLERPKPSRQVDEVLEADLVEKQRLVAAIPILSHRR